MLALMEIRRSPTIERKEETREGARGAARTEPEGRDRARPIFLLLSAVAH
jgi:hypothetical protein